MRRMFYKHIGSTRIAYDPDSNCIMFSTPMYSNEKLKSVETEVSITEEEWQALVKYGQEAGFCG